MAARLLVLGPVAVHVNGVRAPLSGLVADFATVLSARYPYCAERATIIEALWPDGPPATVETRVRQKAVDLRVILSSTDAVVSCQPSGYRLNPDFCSIDAEDFTTLETEARHAFDGRNFRKAATLTKRALDLWFGQEPAQGGPSLEFIEAWRDQLFHTRALCARLQVQALYASGLFGDAIEAARDHQLDVASDPELTKCVMQSQSAIGNPDAARSIFDAHEEYLRDRRQTEPSIGLRRLYERLDSSTPQTGLEEVTENTLPTPDSTPFVERAFARTQFDQSLGQLESPKLLVVSGGSGVGKTRFVLERLREVDPVVTNLLFARASNSRRPMGLWVDFLARLVRSHPEVDWNYVLRPIDRSVVVALLKYGDQSVTAHEVSKAITGWIRARTDAIYIFVDDLHLVDPDSLDVLNHVLRDPTLEHLSVFATVRDDLVGPHREIASLVGDLSRTEHASTIKVTPFSEADCAELAARLDPNHWDGSLDELALESGGNAFFLTELLRAPRDTPAMPSLSQAIDRRLLELSDDARATLEYCSACGMNLDRKVLLDSHSAGLDECTNLGLLHVSKQSVDFVHGLVRRHVYNSLSPRNAEALHCEVVPRFSALGHFVEAARHALLAHPALPLRAAAEELLRAARAPSGALATRSLSQHIPTVLEMAHADSEEISVELMSELRVELARALQDADEKQRTDARRRAIELIEASKNQPLAARFAHIALARRSGGESDTIDLAETALTWDSEAESACLLKSRLAIELCDVDPSSRPAELADDSLSIARRFDKSELLAAALRARLATGTVQVPDPAHRLEWARELTRLGMRQRMPDWTLIGRVHQAIELISLRDREAAEDQLADVAKLANRRQRPRYIFLAHSFRAAIAQAAGDEPMLMSHRDVMEQPGSDSNPDLAMTVAGQQLFDAWHGDRLDTLVPLLDKEWSSEASAVHSCALAWALADTEPARAMKVLQSACGDRFADIPRGSLYLGCLAMAALTVARAGNCDDAKSITALLQPFRGTDLVLGAGVGLFGPTEGILALLAKQPGDEFDEAISETRSSGYRALVARFAKG